MRNKIFKYFFKEFIILFLIILFSFSLIVWIAQSVNFLNYVTEDGYNFKTFFFYSILNLPKITSKLLPFIFFISFAVTLLKFENNNELIIFWINGINKMKLVNFSILISFLVLFIQIVFTTIITPYSLNYSRSILKDSEFGLYANLLKEKKFNNTIKQLIFFVDKKYENEKLENVFIKDNSKDNPRTIIAKSGLIDRNKSVNNLILFDGVIQSKSENNKINFIDFEKTVINLSSFSTKSITSPKLQEKTTLSLLNCFDYFATLLNLKIKNKCTEKTQDIKSEINRRLGMPIYIPLLSVIVCFLFSTKKELINYTRNKYLIFSFAFSIIVISEILVRYSGKNYLNTIVYYSLPLILLIVSYLILIKKFKFENLKK